MLPSWSCISCTEKGWHASVWRSVQTKGRVFIVFSSALTARSRLRCLAWLLMPA